jgi:hypothetical protein
VTDERPWTDAPNVTGTVGWCLFTWATSVGGAAVLAWDGNWPGVVYAVNAGACAAGWWLATDRWSYWQAEAWALWNR